MFDNLLEEILAYAEEQGYWVSEEDVMEFINPMLHILSMDDDPKAKYLYAGYLIVSSNKGEDIQEALRLIEEAAKLGYEDAIALMNSGMEDLPSFPTIDETLIAKAEAGDVEAQSVLGAAYITGEGIEQDQEKGFYWIEKAALQNHRDAVATLGLCYQNGIGTEENLEKAVEWFEKAAEAGNVDVQYQLGCLYLEEYPKDPEKHARGLYWLKTAGENGEGKAAKFYAFNCYIDKAIAEGRISPDTDFFEMMGFVSEQADNGDEEAKKCF